MPLELRQYCDDLMPSYLKSLVMSLFTMIQDLPSFKQLIMVSKKSGN